MTELSGRELDRAVCVVVGNHEVAGVEAKDDCWRYSTSLDACFGPGGITDWLEEHGHDVSLSTIGGIWEAATVRKAEKWSMAEVVIEDPSPATALCRAFLETVDILAREQVGE